MATKKHTRSYKSSAPDRDLGASKAFDFSPSWYRLCEAQTSLCKASGILSGAARALRADKRCDSEQRDTDLANTVLGIVGLAEKAICHALDILGMESRDVIMEVFSLHGLVYVAKFALSNMGQINSAFSENPVADALDIAAELAGTDTDEGIAGKLEVELTQMSAEAFAKNRALGTAESGAGLPS